MIEFNVGGISLDLPSDISIQFVKKNILFSFDSIEVERTTTFNIPVTPNNLRALNFSNDVHRYGTAMRTRVEAQLNMGVVVKNGFLYVSNYDIDGRVFECIFLTGELLELKALREIGNINDIGLETNLFVEYGKVESRGFLTYPAWRTFNNDTYDNIARPSYNLKGLLDMVIAQLGLDISFGEFPQSNLDVVVGTPKKMQPTTFSISQALDDYTQPTDDGFSTNKYNTISTSANVSSVFDVVTYEPYDSEPALVLGLQRYYFPRFLSPKMDVKITFPDDFSSDYYLYGMRDDYGNMVFYGDYGFRVDLDGEMTISYGEPLAGRTIELKKGDAFIIVRRSDYSIVRLNGIINTNGFYPLIRENTIDNLICEAAHDLQKNDIVFLRDNLPSISIIDILKIFAYVSGKVLWYNESTKTIEFDDLDIHNYPVIYLDEIVGKGMMTRTFGDYAQKNTILFNSADSVREKDRLKVAYTIDNVNISLDKELYKIPFSEGNVGVGGMVKISEGDGETLAFSINASVTDYRSKLTKNESLQNILNKCTTQDLSLLMSIYEFNKINDKLVMVIDNAKWIWIDANWDKGIANITMAKV